MTPTIDNLKELIKKCISEVNVKGVPQTHREPRRAHVAKQSKWPPENPIQKPYNRPKPTINPYQGYIDRLLKAIAGDDLRNVSGGHAEEEDDLVIFRLQFKLMNQLALEKLLGFTEKHLGQVRIYPEEHSIVVELRLKKKKAV
jgi:hypothetical protein